ncbi:MAG: preprotein translocase subunit SecG [Pseudomonadota bacterium]
MATLFSILMVAHVLVSLGICALVLLQRGKGADAGAAFGSGASGTVFGARGSANFLSRATAILATLFFVNSLALAYLTTQRTTPDSVVDSIAPTPDAVQTPAPAQDDLGDVPSLEVPEAAADVDPAADEPAVEPVDTDDPPTE